MSGQAFLPVGHWLVSPKAEKMNSAFSVLMNNNYLSPMRMCILMHMLLGLNMCVLGGGGRWITSCWVCVEVGSGARFGCCSRNHHFAWVRKPVLFPSIYLDGQNVEDTCPQGTVSALVIDKRPFPMLKAPTQGRVLWREFLGSRTLAYWLEFGNFLITDLWLFHFLMLIWCLMPLWEIRINVYMPFLEGIREKCAI